MKCQILFSGENKKYVINLSSVKSADRVLSVRRPFAFTEKKNPPFSYPFDLWHVQEQNNYYVKTGWKNWVTNSICVF